MTKIFKAMPFGSARGERQNRVQSVECLDRALLIDTEYSGVHRRVGAQTRGHGRLFLSPPVNDSPGGSRTAGVRPQIAPHPPPRSPTATPVLAEPITTPQEA